MAQIGLGTRFYRFNGLTYDLIASITSFAPGAVTTEAIDKAEVDNLERVKLYIPGVSNNEDSSLGLNFDPDLIPPGTDGQGLLYKDLIDGGTHTYRIGFFVVPSGEQLLQIEAVATGFSVGDITDAGKMEGTFTYQASGKCSWLP